ncbi:16S rRNA methyltransferase [Actinomyces sp. B33]|uniref:transcription antitermination factor NusB n=1 Tax=Actinomyces sp. B33 TaxID=2942131 RepID=UPI00234148D4|nr:transcription antitermination factor NusB [Actinomyces sp. B33]MDC4233319.1 16S rRNA methyltransferase [Actinomyces sp. B33]
MATRRYSDGYRSLRDVDAPRALAYEVLRQVSADGAFANIALPKALRRIRREKRFDARDAAFASELVHGTLRAQGRLDWLIERHLTRPLAQTDPAVVDLLRLGAHQIVDMRVPDHAAVSTTVDLARRHLTDGPARMVNAVLRALTRLEPGAVDEMIDGIEDRVGRLAVRTSHPQWMVRAFEEALVAHGYGADELDDLLDADNVAPVVTLVARPGLIDPEDLADEALEVLGTRVARGFVSDLAVLIESGDPALLPSVREGLAGAQDEGSQLAALVAASAPVDGQDRQWLDLCAGPGGKAALLAALGAGRGARLVANEVHPHRARLIERTVRGLDNVEVVSGDGRSFGGPRSAWPLGSFDRVIVDAPCSGMGSMRRRPESRWRRTESDLDDLTALQEALLDRAVDLVRPGGVLVYVTCSPHARETRAQVERLLASGTVELLDAPAIAGALTPEPLELPAGAGRVAGGGGGRTLQLWDHRHGTDLMFIAVMRRI